MENADKWIHSECWIACFDILGFKKLVSFENDDRYEALDVISIYDETLEHLRKSCNWYFDGCVNYFCLSDTFVMFTSDDTAEGYDVIEKAAKYFMEKCLYVRIPLRGAISVGSFTMSYDNRAFMGKAAVEAFEYAEDQNWIGLILTPTAIKKIESYNLDLINDFIPSTPTPKSKSFLKLLMQMLGYLKRHVAYDEIPMRKFRHEKVYAYRFQNGASNMSNRFLPALQDMKSQADDKYKSKYERTEKFIQKYYQQLG